MAAAPVINPVVILSTYYAFGDVRIVVGRVFFGIVCAVLIGLYFALWAAKGDVLKGDVPEGLFCSCGCFEDMQNVASAKEKFALFLRHSQSEFFSVSKYLIMGIFISSVISAAGTGNFAAVQSGAHLALSMAVMMAMAFLLSLCSSSDAVIARSLTGLFPMGAVMGFLVFGPMMDIKNVLMLSWGFKKRFVGELLAVSFVVCFAVVFMFFTVGGF